MANTEINIGYPSIPFNCVSSAASAEDLDFPHQNLFYGSSTLLFKRGSAGTQTQITFDMGAGNTRTVDFAVFRGANLLIAQADAEVDLSIRGSTDNFASSNVSILSKSNITTTDLVGPRDEDIVLTGAESSAYRYYRIQIDSSTSFEHVLRKCYFGKLFTFGGREPSFGYGANFIGGAGSFEADSGALFRTSSGHRRRIFSFNWRGVTNATRQSFDNEIRRYSEDFPVALIEGGSATEQALNGARSVFAWMTTAQVQRDMDALNLVNAEFVEDSA